ncbi:MAG: multicopper oxidase domain-containing protein, partial [Acidimicrobiia bacterium]|nr:multicopper oxidase domain-containing protein [Acidimicrobiia bacterium]
MPTRRQFLRTTALGGAAMYFNVFGAWGSAFAVPLAAGLSDPALQPKFANPVPNALNPGFIYRNNGGNQKYSIDIRPGVTMTGLLGTNGQPVPTPIFGYGEKGQATWPGKTFEVVRGTGPVEVKWRNKLLDAGGAPVPHLLPVDTSLHWAYSLPGYEQYTIAANGVPTVVHLHGGHTDAPFDGNPEFFFGPGYNTRGPRWMDKSYEYRNDQPAGTLWYHDHALGITRLNVYAGMAGFYIVRDGDDTGRPDNPLGLPAFPYEAAYAIQDRMFHADGRLFYPAFPGDPFYDDFITGEGAILPPELFPGGGPTALAEFFGDHMLVNGVIWPVQNVEPRNYRMRLLNGTDSRFMALRFRVASSPTATDLQGAGAPIPFWVIGADQGLAKSATELDTLLFEPGGRYDVVFDFSSVPAGSRVIVENILGDAPYGGELPEPGDLFPNRQTDRVMAFDVVLPENTSIPDLFDPTAIAGYQGNGATPTRTRKVALFEGLDEFGRLQPLLGTAEPTLAADGSTLEGAIGWHRPTTEN